MESRDRKGAPRGDVARGYSPMKATNSHTGQLQEVVLMDPSKFQSHPAVARESDIELRADIDKAMEQFTLVQRRVIFYVLVQGMSVGVATARMRKSAAYWSNWLYKEALPKLRATLGDYKEKKGLVIR